MIFHIIHQVRNIKKKEVNVKLMFERVKILKYS